MVRIARRACSSRCCWVETSAEVSSIFTQEASRPRSFASASSTSWPESQVRSTRLRSSLATKQ